MTGLCLYVMLSETETSPRLELSIASTAAHSKRQKKAAEFSAAFW
jgi:hypothetical protein